MKIRRCTAMHTGMQPYLVGNSHCMHAVRTWIERVAHTPAPILLLGETGTGKDVVARILAQHGARAGQRYIPINCGALAPELMESELFGHERGAFTGAVTRKEGAFEAAAGGTLLLDEIGELPLALQAKLLRTLESGEVRRVGAACPHHVQVRVVAATHRNLAEEVQRGTFRVDLFHRLHVLVLELPPLRRRLSDLPDLAQHFLQTDAPPGGRFTLHASALDKLARHPWPGNVRELRHVLQRAMLLGQGLCLTADSITFADAGLHCAVLPSPRLQEIEREAILAALQRHAGNRKRTAEALGVSRATLHRRLQALAPLGN